MNISPPVLRVPKGGRIADHLRARRAEPAIDHATIKAVLDELGLSFTNNSRNLAQGWRNSMVKVETDQGPMVIKRYPERWLQESVVHEHSIIDELERRGFPAIRLHHHERTSWAAIDGRIYTATHFVDGSNTASVWMAETTRSKLISDSGGFLASFHECLMGFEPSGSHHASAGATRALNEHIPDGADPTVPADRIAAQVEGLDDQIGHSQSTGVIHADFGLHNLLLRRGQPPTLHDFELSRVDHHLADIAIVVARLPARLVPSFLEGYRERSTMPADEWAKFELVWQRHWYCAALRSWSIHANHGGAGRIERARSRLALAQTDPTSLGYQR